MSTQTIDTAMARRMVEASAIRGAAIIGQPGGWSVMLKLGMQEKPLGAQRSDRPRVWRSLDRCVEYLRTELHLARFDLLDATHFSPMSLEGNKSREAAAERLRRTHEAAAHDKWFREQVEQALKEADDPITEWVPHEAVKADMAKQRATLLKRIKSARK